MLGKLRRQFVAAIMSLVGVVLVFTVASSLVSSWHAQYDAISDSLRMSVGEQAMDEGLIGGRDDHGIGRLIARIMYDDQWGLLDRRDVSKVDADVMSEVVSRVDSGEGSGRDAATHVAWDSRRTPSGYLIAVSDTSDVDAAWSSQLRASVLGVAVGLAGLFGISWWLSGVLIAPIEDAWSRQRRFIADASHELKTPLAVIVANMDILRREGVEEGQRRWVDGSADAAVRMQRLVADLLELARTDETKSGDADAMVHMDVDLSDVAESAALDFDAVAFERHVMIDDDIEPGVHVSGDPEWLSRMVRILVDNAVKYADEGTSVTVVLRRDGNEVRLSVNDIGQVMSDEDVRHVFDRFYRSDEARSRETGGFGLGLAIASGIAEAHGGRIACTSDEGSGTTFTVALRAS